MGLLENTIAGRAPRTSHAHVVDQLGRAIVAGEIAEGELLPSDAELEARFKVSRTVLREAMKTLSAKGLIVPRARIERPAVAQFRALLEETAVRGKLQALGFRLHDTP